MIYGYKIASRSRLLYARFCRAVRWLVRSRCGSCFVCCIVGCIACFSCAVVRKSTRIIPTYTPNYTYYDTCRIINIWQPFNKRTEIRTYYPDLSRFYHYETSKPLQP